MGIRALVVVVAVRGFTGFILMTGLGMPYGGALSDLATSPVVEPVRPALIALGIEPIVVTSLVLGVAGLSNAVPSCTMPSPSPSCASGSYDSFNPPRVNPLMDTSS